MSGNCQKIKLIIKKLVYLIRLNRSYPSSKLQAKQPKIGEKENEVEKCGEANKCQISNATPTSSDLLLSPHITWLLLIVGH